MVIGITKNLTLIAYGEQYGIHDLQRRKFSFRIGARLDHSVMKMKEESEKAGLKLII